MLIGIDLLAIQGPEADHREAARYAKPLVEALLGHPDPSPEFLLYNHEGLGTTDLPRSGKVGWTSLAPALGDGPYRRRTATQRLIDRNPDGLDWLVLLDSLDPRYGVPPEGPVGGLRVASVVSNLGARSDDARLGRLRGHDAILCPSASISSACRVRLGSLTRVTTLGLACDPLFTPPDPSEPLSRTTAQELARLGVTGPYVLSSLSGGAARANLPGILTAYTRLPIGLRKAYQLVVVGPVEEPEAARVVEHHRDAESGPNFLGEVTAKALAMLAGRCSAFLAPGFDEGSGLPLVEAIWSGAPVIAGRASGVPALVGDSSLLVDPSDPSEIAWALAQVLTYADLAGDLRSRSKARRASLGWESVVEAFLEALSAPRVRFDRAHGTRPRIAVIAEAPRSGPDRGDLASRVPLAWRSNFLVDVFGDSGRVDALPPEIGGFDLRLFDRVDGLLGYEAIVYRFATVAELLRRLDRVASRPGLVVVDDPGGSEGEDWLSQVRATGALLAIGPDGLGVEAIERCVAGFGSGRVGHRGKARGPRRASAG